MDKTKIQGRKRWNAYNEYEKEYPRTEAQGLEAYHLSSVWAAVLGKRTGTTVLEEKRQNPESTLYRMRVRREVNGSLIIFIMGFLAGITILGYWELKKRRRTMIEIIKTHKATKKEILDYPVSPERGAESSVSGSSDNGEIFRHHKRTGVVCAERTYTILQQPATVKNAVLSKMEVAL